MRFSSGKNHHFPTEVAEVIDFEDAIVIRLASYNFAASQNILGFDYEGNLLWTIPPPRTFHVYTPYVFLSRHGNYAEALNWDGHIVTLDPKRGLIMEESLYAGDLSPSRRTPSPRRWI